MNFPYVFMFFILLMFSLLIQVSMSSWMFIWIGLEMNMLCIIPMLSSSMKNLNESAIKYFIVQIFGSVILLMGFFFSIFMMMSYYYDDIMSYIYWVSMMLKVGAAPFHFWFPGVLENMTWMNVFMLMTIQKFGLLFIMSYLLKMEIYLIFSVVFSIIIGSFGGFNQVMMRSLFAYSSIGHMGWMIITILMSDIIFMLYYSFYFIMMMIFSLLFHMKGITYINQMFINIVWYEKWIMLMSMLSLGGFPPFSGFFPKIIILNILMLKGEMMLVLMMLIGMLVGLYYYIRLIYVSMMFKSMIMLWLFNMKINKMLNIMLNIILLIMLFVIPMGMTWF